MRIEIQTASPPIFYFIFLEHAGELHIVVLSRRKRGHAPKQKTPYTHINKHNHARTQAHHTLQRPRPGQEAIQPRTGHHLTTPQPPNDSDTAHQPP
jgi:hypothetical protein